MRVAFGLIGGSYWTGGLNYLVNLLSAIHENPDCLREPVLFAGEEVSKEDLQLLLPYLAEPPRISNVWDRRSFAYKTRLMQSLFLQKDLIAEGEYKKANIDVVFQHSAWYGIRFDVPTLAWIADFQHKYLPDLFSSLNYWRREIGYKALARAATAIMLSSDAARKDCEKFYPASKSKTEVLRFAVLLQPENVREMPENVRLKYNLPEKFIYLPNQFWKHKNHYRVVEALEEIKKRDKSITIAVTGALKDRRNVEYPQSVLDKVKSTGCEQQFLYLGMIPREDIIPLMKASMAVLNPSLFEGWSTTVEEAKATGSPLLLSDIPVHREQALKNVLFFDPFSVASIAEQLLYAWENWSTEHDKNLQEQAIATCAENRKKFASEFYEICKRTAG